MRIFLLLLTITTLLSPVAGLADDNTIGDQSQEPVLILTTPEPDQAPAQTQSWSQAPDSQGQSQAAADDNQVQSQPQASQQPAPVVISNQAHKEAAKHKAYHHHRPHHEHPKASHISRHAEPAVNEKPVAEKIQAPQPLQLSAVTKEVALAQEKPLLPIEPPTKNSEAPQHEKTASIINKPIKPVTQAMTPLNKVNKAAPLKLIEPPVELAPPQASFQTLKSELATTKQELNQEQTKTQQSIAALELQNKKLDTELRKVETTEKINSIKATFLSSTSGASNHPANKAMWWFITVALLLIILLWVPMPNRVNAKRKEPILSSVNAVDNMENTEEYDYMNSEEAIPAKLDLARAYIDMDDHFSAEHVLKEVFSKGNEKQRQQAKKLMDELRV